MKQDVSGSGNCVAYDRAIRKPASVAFRALGVILACIALGTSTLVRGPAAIANGFDVEPVPGSCRDFNKFLKEKGVKARANDPESSRHPTWAGVTRPTIEIERALQFTTRKADNGGICSSPSLLQVPIKFGLYIRVLQWRPTVKQSEACNAEVKDFNEFVRSHEDKHRGEMIRIFGVYRKGWARGPKLESCSGTVEEQQAALTAQVNELLNRDLESLAKQFSEESEAFHASPEGRPVNPLNCDICK